MKTLLKKILPPSVLSRLMYARYAMKGRAHAGTRFECPVCRVRVNQFIPLRAISDGLYAGNLEIRGKEHAVSEYETLNVEQYLCPVCGATDRARLYALFMEEKWAKAGRTPRMTLIHFAPEGNLGSFLRLKPFLRYRSADLFRTDVDDTGVDLTDMRLYADASVDCFLCSHILEHVPDDAKAVRELYRILKPGGWGILMAPIMPTIERTYEDFTKTSEEDRLRHFGQSDHCRVYSKADYLQRIAEPGFIVRQLGAEHFGADVFKRCAITPQSVLYIVEK